ncbi:MAG: undecaprenyl-diphosphate phosphatase [Proteobacteria bacterium]|nr:undecaprenyl-diphosphate phosphatase [Pseudomonadota bacterium]
MIESILLGILQGLTEFLPISSSGHLVIVQSLLPGFRENSLLFDVILHAGTLAAVLAYFRDDLKEIASGLLHPDQGGFRLPALLVAGTIPAVLVGLGLRHQIEALFCAPRVASAGLFLTAILLFAAWLAGTKSERSMASLTFKGAFLIGLFQAVAIIPGISRSGATIAAGIFLGLSGREAARFSFLLAIPAIAGAVVLQAGGIQEAGDLSVLLAGGIAAAITGWAAIAFLMHLLKQGVLLPFAVYCLAAGSISLLFLV